MAQQYRIKNWAKFQHYKDRNPPWIKLHVEILASEDWVMLDDASKLVMIVCMIVAAKFDGIVSDDAAYFRRVAYLNKTPNLKPLIECGFLQPLSDASGAEQMLADARPEKEAEQSRAEKEKIIDQPRASRFGEFWAVYPRKLGRGKAEKLFDGITKKLNPDVLIAAASKFRVTQAGTEEKFIPYATTWLNGRRWEDEDCQPNVIALTAFNSPEELEGQRLARERLYGKTGN
jgi:hypothetical protein